MRLAELSVPAFQISKKKAKVLEKSDNKPQKEAQAKGVAHGTSQPAAAPAAGHGRPQAQQNLPKAAQKQHSKDYRGIIRLVGKDIEGYWPLERALIRVKGIGLNLARNLSLAIERDLKISPKTDVGELSEEQLLEVESVIKSPAAHGVKEYALDRIADPFDGKTKHLLATDLTFLQKQDLQREVDSKSYNGWRRQLGQRVRGQRSRTTNRTGMAVGVLKKALKQAKAGGAAESAPAEKEKKK